MEKKSVLIVDDTPDNLLLINTLLKETYRTKIATNGLTALEIARSEDPPDLILLDIMMPEMDGYEVCMLLKAGLTTRDIPVIFLTAMTQVEDEKKGLELGAVDYITKPISPGRLFTRVSTHLRLKEATDRLRNQADELEQMVQERTHRLSLLNQALERFVPKAFLRALGRANVLDVGLGDHMYGEMTILFSDIRSYTAHAEGMTPQEVFAFTNGYHNRMSPIIHDSGGFVQQFQGDGVVSVFPRSAADGVEAAIGIQQRVRAYNEERRAKGRFAIEVGIGLHAGPLMVGIIGDAERWESGIPSDTVNTAARMEGLTKHYGASIVLSGSTLAGLPEPDHYDLRLLDKVRVIGKSETLEIYDLFTADPEPLKERKLQTMQLFGEGQQHFFSRRFADAVKCFTDVLMVLPEDVTTRLYLQRASKCLLEGVPDDWECVRALVEK